MDWRLVCQSVPKYSVRLSDGDVGEVEVGARRGGVKRSPELVRKNPGKRGRSFLEPSLGVGGPDLMTGA